MSEIEVNKTRFFAGVWEGVVSTPGNDDIAPVIQVHHLGNPIPDVNLTKRKTTNDEWNLRFSVPLDLLSDGVQVFLIVDTGSGEKLGSFTIVTGEPLEDDIRAETELLRAELDMLKRAFRRHCLENP